MKILITGGAGFIGSHIVTCLADKSAEVTILDNLSTQTHGEDPINTSPSYKLAISKANFYQGDVRNISDWKKLILDQDVIIHLAAETGTGQSMYEIKKYTDVNIRGTALMLEVVSKYPNRVKKIILSSSRAVYGEGKYNCSKHGDIYPGPRLKRDLLNNDFECKCPICAGELKLRPTDEESKLNPISIYGITKQVQEQYIRSICNAIELPYTILRFQNVFGPGQSLSNPYTGILSIFSNLILNNGAINIFEDGLESRDFIYVDDVAQITSEIAISDKANNETINIGTGGNQTVIDIVNILMKHYNKNVDYNISGDFRIGDIRHNYADIEKLRSIGLLPRYTFDEGIKHFVKWVKESKKPNSQYKKSLQELKSNGLLLSGK